MLSKTKKKREWQQLFMDIAKRFSEKSEDESTKVGAIIVDQDKNVRALSYNGLPRGIRHLKKRQRRKNKYNYFVHAEINVICSAARIGVSTKGCSLYVTMSPCADCARAIIQAGIKEVIVESLKVPERWKESIGIALEMFKEAEVKVIELQKK